MQSRRSTIALLATTLLVVVILLGINPPRRMLSQDAVQDTASQPPDDLGPAWDGTYRRIRIPILMYHYVSPLPPNADQFRIGLSITPETFRAHLDYLFREGYTTISLYQMHDALLTGMPLPPKPVVLTFDDGYIDHYTNVFPALQEYGFTGTFFIITARADMNDRQYVSWAQIREMADAGMSMEAHTKNHSSLQGRDYDFLVYEMLGSLESLYAFTGRQAHMLAYPVGQYDDETLRVAGSLPVWRAVTTERGSYQTTDNRLEVPRVRILGGMGVAGLAESLSMD